MSHERREATKDPRLIRKADPILGEPTPQSAGNRGLTQRKPQHGDSFY